MNKDLKYYLNLKYPIEIRKLSKDAGGGYIASILQLGDKAFCGDGKTIEEAVKNLNKIKKYLFQDYIKKGIQILEPKKEPEKIEVDWYIECIEEPIRDLVKLLRDNGFNTVNSCGHEMYIQCDFLLDGEFKRLHDLLYNSGYRDYTITVNIQVIDGHLYNHFEIKLPKEEKEKND